MSWIKTIPPDEAHGKLTAAYERVGGARGRVANIIGVHSLAPGVMTAHLEIYREIVFGRSELSRTEREMVATAVSSVNHCHY